MRQQNQTRCGLVIVELGHESSEDICRFSLIIMSREEGLVAPVLAGAEEKDLDAGAPAILGHRDDVGFLDPGRVDALVCRYRGNGPDPVAQARGALEVEIIRCGLHALLQICAQRVGLAAQEGGRLRDQLVIGVWFDQVDAGPGAALDLVQHAGASAAFIDAVGTGPDHEGLLQCVEGVIDRADRGEGAEIIALDLARPAMLEQLRRCVVLADEDVGKALVVAQQDVEAWLERLDQIGFEQQGFGFGFGDHEFHRPRQRNHQRDAVGVAPARGIVGDAVFQIARLADIEHRSIFAEHAINARLGRQAFDVFSDELGPRQRLRRRGGRVIYRRRRLF